MNGPLDDLEEIVAKCKKCPLHCSRNNSVFGRGRADAPLMLIGGAPGKSEDKQGYPFARFKDHLSGLLRASGVPEDDVYMTSVLKCLPPSFRFPDGAPPETCRKYLLQQIEIVKPSAIICAGQEALQYVLLHGTTDDPNPFTPWTNKIFRRKDLYGDVRVLVVYEPGYLAKQSDEEDEECWVQAVSELWSYVKHKRAGTAPAPLPFTEIKPPPVGPRQGRNLFSMKRKDAL